ncbi:hypothetical protein LIP_3361 [Limnochorda pilosa]|uniref:EfeO-type cupredoxin-like domain-containing protein n=1 Tax=Limnochorda pilosa TaxID=1555112 RepID=A0A0K2SPX7_LIMPI|nr:hypothetical protein LIP_3361 [Limnochorda pilosa]
MLVAVLGLAAIAFLASGMGWRFGGFWGVGPMGWGMMGGRGPMMGGAPSTGWGPYGTGYGPGGSAPPVVGGSEAPVPRSDPGGEPGAPGAQVTVEMSEFAFKPGSFTWKAEEPVRLSIVNVGRAYHDFTIPGIPVRLPDGRSQEGIQVGLGPGGSQVVQFTPTEAGRFPLLCTVPGHASAGMQGQVTVL